MAQIAEIRLCNGALNRHSRRWLASVGDDKVLLAVAHRQQIQIIITLTLATPTSHLLSRWLCLRGSWGTSSLGLCRQLLPTAIKDGDHVASILFRNSAQLLLQRVHARPINHTVRRVIHHPMSSIVHEKKRVPVVLILLLENLRVALIYRLLDIPVRGVSQDLDFTIFEL